MSSTFTLIRKSDDGQIVAIATKTTREEIEILLEQFSESWPGIYGIQAGDSDQIEWAE